jgi:hypothetical protein
MTGIYTGWQNKAALASFPQGIYRKRPLEIRLNQLQGYDPEKSTGIAWLNDALNNP